MSTTPIVCPYCGGWLRVAVQAAHITKSKLGDQLRVVFHEQLVAHVCKENKNERTI